MHGWKITFLLEMAYFEGGTIKLPGSTTLEPEGIPLLCVFGGYSGMVDDGNCMESFAPPKRP